jgi:hypothetical protein
LPPWVLRARRFLRAALSALDTDLRFIEGCKSEAGVGGVRLSSVGVITETTGG